MCQWHLLTQYSSQFANNQLLTTSKHMPLFLLLRQNSIRIKWNSPCKCHCVTLALTIRHEGSVDTGARWGFGWQSKVARWWWCHCWRLAKSAYPKGTLLTCPCSWLCGRHAALVPHMSNCRQLCSLLSTYGSQYITIHFRYWRERCFGKTRKNKRKTVRQIEQW